MAKNRLRVLVLYGGDGATNPRNELLAWLARKTVNVEARVVAEDAPHTDGAVDDRVDAAMEWADKAIALVTPDKRSEHGAPNVMDEIGRWRGRKGKKTICIVRQDGVPPYSNHAGLVYVGFRERIKEAFDPVREFLLDGSELDEEVERGEQSPPTAASPQDLIVESSSNLVLIEGHPHVTSRIEEAQGRLTIELINLNGQNEVALRNLNTSRRQIGVVYGNTAAVAEIDDFRLTHGEGVAATLTLRIVGPTFGVMHDVSLGGVNPLSADQIATLRASRILFNDPAGSDDPRDFREGLVRGGMQGTTEVRESPIPGLLKILRRDEIVSWEVVRLFLILQLRLSGCVEHVERLALTVRSGRLVRIEFRGRRAKHYVNHEPYLIELNREIDF